jgi:redox-sensitive transcriptional activator SoxR
MASFSANASKKTAEPAWLPIGELARRAGVAASALRFYEAQGLIHGGRSAGGRRQYPRHVLRRVAFLRAGQRVGLSLEELRQALAALPDNRTPTRADWDRLARGWQALLDARLAQLQRLRDHRGRPGPRRPAAGAWRSADQRTGGPHVEAVRSAASRSGRSPLRPQG